MFIQTIFQKINLVLAFLCILILGIIIGKYQERILINQTNSQIALLNEDINQTIPTVKILGLQDGVLRGTFTGSGLHLSTETEVATYDQEFNFTLNFNDVLRKDLLYNVPAKMNYIASSRGKKFYNIYDRSASKIAPQNRIFFQTKVEALAAGYLAD